VLPSSNAHILPNASTGARSKTVSDRTAWVNQIRALYAWKQNMYWERKVDESAGNPRRLSKTFDAVLCNVNRSQNRVIPMLKNVSRSAGHVPLQVHLPVQLSIQLHVMSSPSTCPITCPTNCPTTSRKRICRSFRRYQSVACVTLTFNICSIEIK